MRAAPGGRRTQTCCCQPGPQLEAALTAHCASPHPRELAVEYVPSWSRGLCLSSIFKGAVRDLLRGEFGGSSDTELLSILLFTMQVVLVHLQGSLSSLSRAASLLHPPNPPLPSTPRPALPAHFP